MNSDIDPNCRFCPGHIQDRVIDELGSVQAFEDRFPVSPGHCLIIPVRHTIDWFTMSTQERRDAERLLLELRQWLVANDQTITGFNIGINCGRSAGQTIFSRPHPPDSETGRGYAQSDRRGSRGDPRQDVLRSKRFI